MLVAWASLQSIARLRRNVTSKQFLSIIFKPCESKQPWVLNLVIPEHEACIRQIVTLLQSVGVTNKKQNIRVQDKKFNESEVTKEAIMDMDITQIVENMHFYEQEIAR